MPKSFIPQFLRILKRLSVYLSKHQATIVLYLSPAQVSCLTALIAAINDCTAMFPGYQEQP